MHPVNKISEIPVISELEYKENMDKISQVISTEKYLSNLKPESGNASKKTGNWTKKLDFLKKIGGTTGLIESTLKMALLRLNNGSTSSQEEIKTLMGVGSGLCEAYRRGTIDKRIAKLSCKIKNKAGERLVQCEKKEMVDQSPRLTTSSASHSLAVLAVLGDVQDSISDRPAGDVQKHRMIRSPRSLASIGLELLVLKKIAALEERPEAIFVSLKKEDSTPVIVRSPLGEGCGNSTASGSGEILQAGGDSWKRRQWAKVRWLQAGGDRTAAVRLEIFGKNDEAQQEVGCNLFGILQKLANAGDVRAQYERGMYFLRQSQLPEEDQARIYEVAKAQLETAASQGSEPAKIALRRMEGN